MVNWSGRPEPALRVGQRVRLVESEWGRRYRGCYGHVREAQWQGVSLAAPDGYWYLVDLEYQAVTIRGNTNGFVAVPAEGEGA